MMSKAQKQPAASTGRNKMTWRRFRRYIPIYVIMLPGLIYLFINNYMPLPGLVVAFKQYNARKGIYKSDWIGFKNFEYLFTTNDAWVITRNTIAYNLAFIVINTALAIVVAIILSEIWGKAKKFYQSAIRYFPFSVWKTGLSTALSCRFLERRGSAGIPRQNTGRLSSFL